MDKIGIVSRSSNQVDVSRSTRLLRFRLMLGEISEANQRWKFKLKNFDSPKLTENYYLELMENRLRSRRIFSPST